MKRKLFIYMAALVMITLGNASISLSSPLQHFTGLTPTPFMIDFVGKLRIKETGCRVGDEIGVFNEEGLLCGACVVKKTVQYGILHVYGDDPSTHEIEGFLPDQELHFVVWDAEGDIEYPVSVDEMTPFSLGTFQPAPIPPAWSFDKVNYGLNIHLMDEEK